MTDRLPIGAWLTVNRFCNFRCLWCYAKETEYKKSDDMSMDLAENLVNLLASIGVQSVILIGGEPTFWKPLFKINSLIQSLGMKAFLVTNGFRFSDDKFLQQAMESPFDFITVSLKAGNDQQQIELTRTHSFPKVLAGIGNLSKGSKLDVSITLTSLIADNLAELVKAAIDAGAETVKIEFCAATFKGGKSQKGFMLSPDELVACVMKHYDTIDNYTNGRIMIEQSLPFCIWPEGVLDHLEAKNQIISGCHLLRREGIIFDARGNVIACNDLHDYPLGKYRNDFNDAKTFEEFWFRKDVVEFYDQIIAYPSKLCINCLTYDDCGGGCPLQWFIHNPDAIIAPKLQGGTDEEGT